MERPMEEPGVIGSRILVLGAAGSGKSTFSRRLRDVTGLPLVHLDNLWWKPDRTHISRAEFDRALAVLLEDERWILDGDYSRTYEMRIRACQTVFFLDYDPAVSMDGVLRRVGQPRPDMPWTDQEPDPELIALVRQYREVQRPQLLELFERYPDKRVIVFRSREEADQWLSRAEKNPVRSEQTDETV